MNIKRALTIPGFTNENELLWLATQASKCQCVVEIGSWKGRSTVAIAENLPEGGVVYAVDTWKGTKEDPHFRELAGKPEDWLLNEFGANVGEALLAGPKHIVRPYQNTSHAGADYLGNHYGIKFDMIFIDADHSYDAVRNDILAWQPHLAPGGLMCGHDFEPGRGGVIPAVRSVYPKARKVGVGTIWVTE